METIDGRRIISGLYYTEEKKKACLNPEQWSEWKKEEKTIAARDTGTLSIVRKRGRNQHTTVGKPGDINPWGRSEGTIGSTIDYYVQLGIFTKEQIRILAGTKMSKVRSHLYSMKKKGKYTTTKDSKGIISFKNKIVTVKKLK
jgi:hypothetical protein